MTLRQLFSLIEDGVQNLMKGRKRHVTLGFVPRRGQHSDPTPLCEAGSRREEGRLPDAGVAHNGHRRSVPADAGQRRVDLLEFVPTSDAGG